MNRLEYMVWIKGLLNLLQLLHLNLHWNLLWEGSITIINLNICLQELSEPTDPQGLPLQTSGGTSHPVHLPGEWVMSPL